MSGFYLVSNEEHEELAHIPQSERLAHLAWMRQREQVPDIEAPELLKLAENYYKRGFQAAQTMKEPPNEL